MHLVMAWKSVDLPTFARPTCFEFELAHAQNFQRMRTLVRYHFSGYCLVGLVGSFLASLPSLAAFFVSYWRSFGEK